MPDRGHLDNNPIPVTKQDIVKCLSEIVKRHSNGLPFTISLRHLTISCLVTGIGLLSKCPRSGIITSAA